MRRIIIIATAVAALGGAAVALGQNINAYTATFKFSPNKAGTATKPVAMSFTVSYSATGTGGNRTAPLDDVKTTIYGIKANWKGFPTCSEAQISAAHNDTGCPAGAMVASGSITAVIGPTSNQSTSAPGTLPCDPLLHVWNAGGGQLIFFFVEGPSNVCANGALTTGSIPPYTATISQQGKNVVLDVPVPSYVSFPISGLEGSLETLTLNWPKKSIKVKGKTAYDFESVACSKGERPYSVAFTANEPGQPNEVGMATGMQKCSK